MTIRLKSQLLIAAAIAVAFMLAAVTSGLITPAGAGQVMNLAAIDQLQQSSEKSKTYQLIPESIMTGLCWRTDDGSRAGIFKDINAGIAQWTEKAPDTELSASGRPVDYVDLSNQLSRVSFEATDYIITQEKAEISGVLTVADRQRRIALEIDNTGAASDFARQDLIELNASAELEVSDFGTTLLAVNDGSMELCLTIQASRNVNIPDPSSGKPMMLSHYY